MKVNETVLYFYSSRSILNNPSNWYTQYMMYVMYDPLFDRTLQNT